MSTPRTSPGARWSCSGCGACCQGYQYGPVEPELVAELERQEVHKRWAPAATRPWVQLVRGPDGVERHFLTKIEGRCIFLRPDNLCALHAMFGPTGKPGFCREYPFHVVDDALGTSVIVRSDCFGAPTHQTDGEPVAQQVEAVLALPRAAPRRPFAPAMVSVLPGVTIPTARWMAWESELLALLAGPYAGPEEAVVALRKRLFELAGEAPPSPSPAKRRAALGALCLGVQLVMQRAGPPPAGLPAFERELLDDVTGLVAGARAALESGDDLRGPLSPSARAWVHSLLESHLLGKLVHRHGAVAEGLGAFLLDAALVRVATGGDPDAPAAALAPTLPRWSRFTGNEAVQGLLRIARPALLDLFLST